MTAPRPLDALVLEVLEADPLDVAALLPHIADEAAALVAGRQTTTTAVVVALTIAAAARAHSQGEAERTVVGALRAAGCLQ
jgi:hypothetical protein